MNLPENVEILFSQRKIAHKVKELAGEVAADYSDKSLLLLGTLTGAYVLLGDFGRQLALAGKTDAEVDTIGVTSYGNGRESNRDPQINKPLKLSPKDKHVLLIEDIADTRHTLAKLMLVLGSEGASSVEILSLLSKTSEKEIDVPIKYLGWEIPKRFVFGYGIDAGEQWRTLPFIAAYKE